MSLKASMLACLATVAISPATHQAVSVQAGKIGYAHYPTTDCSGAADPLSTTLVDGQCVSGGGMSYMYSCNGTEMA